MDTYTATGIRLRWCCLWMAVLLLGDGCAFYPKIGPAAKPVADDQVVGTWKSHHPDLKLRCKRLPSNFPEYRVSDAHFWYRLLGLTWPPDRDLVFYEIRHQLWYETYAPPGSKEANSTPTDETVEVGLIRFVGPDKFYQRPLDSKWVRNYAVRHPKVLPYQSISKDSNDVIITASPERWYWFLENKVHYPKSFGVPSVFYRAR